MVFSSFTYLLFFIAVFSIYWTIKPWKARLTILLLASWLFYAAWHPVYIFLFIGTIFINWALANIIAQYRDRSGSNVATSLLTAITVVLDLSLLGAYKYLDFLIETIWPALIIFGQTDSNSAPPLIGIFLPLGISFYTFQAMAYVIDVKRGVIKEISPLPDFFLFISFFPQLIAGPICRSNELLPQISTPKKWDASDTLRGLDLIFLGLFKKVVVADQMASFVDLIFSAPHDRGSAVLLLGIYAYAIQIYCDFSGYTDIGRGSARCLGFKLPENFAHPYLAPSIVIFWRRWHMTLSRWLRDYLYIPLGGSRKGRSKTYRNLALTMLLGGLWHGASWSFVVWGALHGGLLAFLHWLHEKRKIKSDEPLVSGKIWFISGIIFTFHYTCLAWIFFRAPSFEIAFEYIKGICTSPMLTTADKTNQTHIFLIFISTIFCILMHLSSYFLQKKQFRKTTLFSVLRPIAWFITLITVLLLLNRGPDQFIYFQF